jgi:DNA-binding IclR family transcriptional regulator
LPWTTRYLGKYVGAICAGIAAIAALLELARLAPGAVCIAVVLSGVAFRMLARWRSRLSPELLRVAADLALCTPLLVLPFLW